MPRMVLAPELDSDGERVVRFLLTLDERCAIMDGANIEVRLSDGPTPEIVASFQLEVQGVAKRATDEPKASSPDS